MKKEEKNIVINKDNYKGYAELYKAQHSVTDEEDNYYKQWGVKIAFGFLCAAPILLTKFIPIMEVFTNIGLAIWAVGLVSTLGIGAKGISNLKKEKYQAVKEEYPYIDLNVNRDALEKSLEDVGILQYEFKDGLCLSYLKVEEYENYLKAEEIKKNYLEETKYDGYIINPPIEQEELEKVKVKVKSLTR